MIRTYPFSQVDAFTQTRLHGNPCAIIHNADDLTDHEMLAIAREMNLSETSFVLKSRVADFRLRYFTPAEEIPLAGHPTIATVYRLYEMGLVAPGTVRIELQAGVIDVRLAHSADGVLVTMSQLRPQFLTTYAADEILPFFGLTPSDVMPGLPLQTVSTGTPMLMVPLKNRAVLEQVQFDANGFAQFRASADFFSAHLFCLEGYSAKGDTAARHFCPPPDVLEDPFTGSATGAMGCYLWKFGHRRNEFCAEQGHSMGRPGEARVRVLSAGDDIIGVEVAGYAVTSMIGEIFV